MRKKLFLVALLSLLVLSLAACGNSTSSDEGAEDAGAAPVEKKLVLADASWDSIRVHNAIAKIILEEGYGYEIELMPGSSPNLVAGHTEGDINVIMECWPDNWEAYQPAVDEGKIIEVGLNFDDNAQGLYVPRYMIEGDAERGIKAVAPELKTVEDLKKYANLFPDQEDPGMGAIVNAPPAWGVAKIMETKFENYGLDEVYNLVSPGSDSGLAASLAGAYEKGDPWVGYYWEPTWISGKYDIVLLEEAPYEDEAWNDGYRTAFKPVRCTITMDEASYENHPEVAEFLSKYKTSSALVGEILAYMQTNETDIQETAEWFLKEKQDVWKSWVSEETFNTVLGSLE